MKKKYIISFIIILVLIISGVAIRFMYRLNKYKKTINNMKFEEYKDLAINDIADGTYEGESDVDFIYVKLNTTVKDKKITKIEILEHRNGKGAPAEKIVENIIKEQSLEVDDVVGATNSSKVIKEAIKNSLKNNK